MTSESIEDYLGRLGIDVEQAQSIADDYRANMAAIDKGGKVNYLIIQGVSLFPKDRKELAGRFPPKSL